MNNRIAELEKEITLTKQLIELRKQLDAISQYQPVFPKVSKFGDTDFATPYWKFGSTVSSLATTQDGTLIVTGTISKANDQLSLWPSSEEMWEGTEKPHYNECSLYYGCDCKGA